MNLWQRCVYKLAEWSGLLPAMPSSLVAQARLLVREIDSMHGRESNEYRRHLVFTRLTQGGVDKRAAAIAIEVAVHKEF